MNYDFYVVWNPRGKSPMRRHSFEHQAREEAERLALRNPGHEFYVLHAVSVSEQCAVATRQLEPQPPLPF
jgi:hypothetical protein